MGRSPPVSSATASASVAGRAARPVRRGQPGPASTSRGAGTRRGGTAARLLHRTTAAGSVRATAARSAVSGMDPPRNKAARLCSASAARKRLHRQGVPFALGTGQQHRPGGAAGRRDAVQGRGDRPRKAVHEVDAAVGVRQRGQRGPAQAFPGADDVVVDEVGVQERGGGVDLEVADRGQQRRDIGAATVVERACRRGLRAEPLLDQVFHAEQRVDVGAAVAAVAAGLGRRQREAVPAVPRAQRRRRQVEHPGDRPRRPGDGGGGRRWVLAQSWTRVARAARLPGRSTSPRHAPVSRPPRSSTKVLDRPRSPLPRRSRPPSSSATFSTKPSGSMSSCAVTRVCVSSSRRISSAPSMKS